MTEETEGSSASGTGAACLGCAAIAIIFLLVFGGIVWALYHFGAIDKIKSALSSDGADEQQAVPAKQEQVASETQEARITHALKKFVAAQEIHKRDFGVYTSQPENLIGMGSVKDDTGAATSPDSAFYGYYFIGLEKQGPGRVNLGKGFVFVAVPAKYNATTRYTYAISPIGKVLKRDIGPEIIENVSQIDRSWELVK